METESKIEAAKATFPQYTVYMCYRGDKPSAHTGDWFANFGKDYADCTRAKEQAKEGDFVERQDKDLYTLAKKLEAKSEHEPTIERLKEFISHISDLIEDEILDWED